MSVRRLSASVFVLVAFGMAAQASAELLCGAVNCVAREVKRRQCWPEPFNAWDRAAVRSPFVVMVNNGWRRQNMLGEFHFETGTGQLTEAGRLKVQWILTAGPQQHRTIYVHTANDEAETTARIAAVEQLASRLSPDRLPPILTTTIPDEGWPADQVDLINRKYREESIPWLEVPGLPKGGWTSDAGTGGSGGSN